METMGMRGRGTWGIGFIAMVMVAVTLGLSGCSLFTPARSEVGREQVSAKIDGSALVQEGVLTVALDFSDAPQGMVASDGTVTGYDTDVARALASNLGLSVAFVDAASPSDVLANGTEDVYVGASSTDSSDAVTVFGDCLEDAPALFAGKAVSTVTASSLADMVVGVQGSSAAQDALNKAGIVGEQRTYSNVNECFEALAAGEVDCVACDATAGAYLARAYEGVTFAGTLDAVTVYGVAAASSNSAVVEAVSAALEEVSSSGALSAAHAAWYGSLPLVLSDAALPGVTITLPDSALAGDRAAAEGSLIESDVDINELNG